MLRYPALIGFAVLTLVVAGCSDGGDGDPSPSAGGPDAYAFPRAPTVIDTATSPEVDRAVSQLVAGAAGGVIDSRALATVSASHDARLGWLVSDLLRFYQGSQDEVHLVEAFGMLTGVDVRKDPLITEGAWKTVTDHMLAWDLPAPTRYRELKAKLFLAVEPRWKPFFSDAASEVDWRRLSWGGVLIDDRPLGDPAPCPGGCIPALDDPALTAAAAGDWYPDDRIVFGIVIGDDAIALPKNVMEIHEMVNTTVGGRRLGIPYCTLCGSAQAYFLDATPVGVGQPVLRTSGLLTRSNKVMYDLVTRSVFDTFTGRALSGPLHRKQVTLEQATVVTSTWAEWKRAHPATKIVAQDGGIGRSYELDPLGGRDDSGPIFPIGDVDRRLATQTQVVGVVTPDGETVAFVADAAREALRSGKRVEASGVELVADGGGLRARSDGGQELPSHQAFWFAWSQFHPETDVWLAPSW